jgi:hypothetical protein
MICDNLNNPTSTPTSQTDCPSGTTFDSVGKQCVVCTRLDNGKTECHSAGAYDAKSNFTQGSIDTDASKTDVLSKAATTNYSDWLTDPTTSSDLRGSGGGSSFLGSHYIDGSTKLITESDADKPYDTIEDDYDDLTNERNFSYDDDEEEDSTEEAYIKLTNNRKTAKELIESAKKRAAYRNSKMYGRYMERPSDMDYDDYVDDDYAEGFAARL